MKSGAQGRGALSFEINGLEVKDGNVGEYVGQGQEECSHRMISVFFVKSQNYLQFMGGVGHSLDSKFRNSHCASRPGIWPQINNTKTVENPKYVVPGSCITECSEVVSVLKAFTSCLPSPLSNTDQITAHHTPWLKFFPVAPTALRQKLSLVLLSNQEGET